MRPSHFHLAGHHITVFAASPKLAFITVTLKPPVFGARWSVLILLLSAVITIVAACVFNSALRGLGPGGMFGFFVCKLLRLGGCATGLDCRALGSMSRPCWGGDMGGVSRVQLCCLPSAWDFKVQVRLERVLWGLKQLPILFCGFLIRVIV